LKFYGEHKEGKGTVCGVQLHAPKGKNNGVVGGNTYFECPPGHGVLVKPELVDVDVNTYTDFNVRG
jgi:dynactin complex subunit